MAGRAKENLPGGSLKYLFVYFEVRIFKCSYRICSQIYPSTLATWRWKCLQPKRPCFLRFLGRTAPCRAHESSQAGCPVQPILHQHVSHPRVDGPQRGPSDDLHRHAHADARNVFLNGDLWKYMPDGIWHFGAPNGIFIDLKHLETLEITWDHMRTSASRCFKGLDTLTNKFPKRPRRSCKIAGPVSRPTHPSPSFQPFLTSVCARTTPKKPNGK